jgi:hypothetical protein
VVKIYLLLFFFSALSKGAVITSYKLNKNSMRLNSLVKGWGDNTNLLLYLGFDGLLLSLGAWLRDRTNLLNCYQDIFP